MNEFIKTLLSLSFSGTLLLLLLLLLKSIYKNIFSKCWQYYIWLIVAFRFLVPIPTVTPMITVTDYLMEKTDTIKDRSNGAIKIKQNKVIAEKKDSVEERKQSSMITKNFCFSFLWFLWIVFALILFLRKVLHYQNFVHRIKKNSIEVSEVKILNILADCEEIEKISKPVELYHNSWIASPIMTGFFHPKIILSTEQYKEEEMFYIFLHELIHYKRCDMIYKWFIQIIICIHWFNPFIYLLGKEINRACELSCDEAVISCLGDKEKKAYGDVLITALKVESAYKNPDTSVTFAESTKQIKERLGAIMDFKKKTKLIKIITVFFTIAICICFSAIGVYASNNNIVSENINKTRKKDNLENTKAYMQSGFFHNSYLIEMGWNLNEKDKKSIASKAEITLKDKSKMTIYFYKETKEYAEDKKVLTAIKEVIEELRDSNLGYPKIKEPYIYRIDYVHSDQISDFVKKSYKENDIIGFSAVFSKLDVESQKKYYKKAYVQDKIDFFACIIKNMDKDTIVSYIKKAIKDENEAFFSVLLAQLSSKEARQLVKKQIKYFYKTDDFAFFSISLKYLSEKEKKMWLEQADKDEKEAFYFIISENL